MNLIINDLLYTELVKNKRIKPADRQFFPSQELHPELSINYDLKVYTNIGQYVNEDRFGVYLSNLNFHVNEHIKEIESIYKQIQYYFKKFNQINIQDVTDKYNIIFGVLSRFNFEDIKFYVEKWSPIVFSCLKEGRIQYKEYRKWWDDLTNKKEGLYWIASPITRLQIEKLYSENKLCIY